MITASWVEIALMMFNLGGIGANVHLLNLMRSKKRAALLNGARPDGPRILAANRYLRGEAIRIVLHVAGCIIVAGLMLLPPDVRLDHWFLTAAAYLALIVNAALVYVSILDLTDDGRLTRMLQAEDL